MSTPDIYELADDLRRALKRVLGEGLISVAEIDSTFGQKQVVVRLTLQGTDEATKMIAELRGKVAK